MLQSHTNSVTNGSCVNTTRQLEIRRDCCNRGMETAKKDFHKFKESLENCGCEHTKAITQMKTQQKRMRHEPNAVSLKTTFHLSNSSTTSIAPKGLQLETVVTVFETRPVQTFRLFKGPSAPSKFESPERYKRVPRTRSFSIRTRLWYKHSPLAPDVVAVVKNARISLKLRSLASLDSQSTSFRVEVPPRCNYVFMTAARRFVSQFTIVITATTRYFFCFSRIGFVEWTPFYWLLSYGKTESRWPRRPYCALMSISIIDCNCENAITINNSLRVQDLHSPNLTLRGTSMDTERI